MGKDWSVGVLVVTPYDQDRMRLESILQPPRWRVYAARDLQEAVALAQIHSAQVTICESELPDGTWKCLLDALAQLAVQPRLIVSSRLADDRLWAEVLNLGGYDVVLTPFEADEVRRAVHLASNLTWTAGN